MHIIPSRVVTRTLVAAALATLVAACSDADVVSPSGPVTLDRAALGSCTNLQAPNGSVLAFRVYALGAQIYRWSGSAWVFVAPAADLFTDARGTAKIGTHFAGPTWLANTGSRVVGTVIDRCTPNPESIPWLSLSGAPDNVGGIFHDVRFIQRINTVGGNAPEAPGTAVGEERQVPYSAEYYFYR